MTDQANAFLGCLLGNFLINSFGLIPDFRIQMLLRLFPALARQIRIFLPFSSLAMKSLTKISPSSGLILTSCIMLFSLCAQAQELRTSITLEGGGVYKPAPVLDWTAGISFGFHWQNFTFLTTYHRWFQADAGLKAEADYLVAVNKNVDIDSPTFRNPSYNAYWGYHSISAALLYDVVKSDNSPWSVSLGAGVCALDMVYHSVSVDSDKSYTFPQISRPLERFRPVVLGMVGYSIGEKIRLQSKVQAHGFEHYTVTCGIQFIL